MMRAIAAGIFGAFLFVGIAHAAVETEAKLKVVLEAQYAKIIAAEKAKDWKALEAILAPNYRSIDTDGTIISRTREMKQDEETPAVRNERDRITVLSVDLKGDQLFVQQRFNGRFDQTGQDGKSHRFVIVAYSSDLWRRNGTGWICEQTITNVQDVSVDGQPVAHDVYQPIIA
jgi:hypothetical protein